MTVGAVTAQLRTTDLEASIRFWTEGVGLELDFLYGNFYAGIRTAGGGLFHLKHVDTPDPSIAYVRHGDHLHLYIDTDDAHAMVAALARRGIDPVTPLHETDWGTREFAILDDQGHTIYFGEIL